MLIVGIDGGGTKTDAVLCDETGRVKRRVRGGPGSPTSQPVDQAVENIGRVLRALTDGCLTPIDSLYAGLSGGAVGDNAAMMHGRLTALVPDCKQLGNHTDATNALRSAIPSGDALVVICGTGSSVFAQVADGLHQVGGWGHLLGDEGSGFDLGRRALMSALRELDGRGPHTGLTAACNHMLGEEVRKAIPALYAGGRAMVASFAPVLLDQAAKGDAIALAHMGEAVHALAEQVRTAGGFLKAAEKPVALAGSVWQNALYREHMQEVLGDAYHFHQTDLPPVYGSCVMALQQAGITVTDDVTHMFRQSLASVPAIAV